MKHFAKVAVAAVLMAGAGAANASIAYDQGSNNEAYMSAYDFTTGKTFTFDTGVSFGQLLSNVANAAYSLSFDFSNDSNWLNFITGAATNKIKWVVAVANTTDFGTGIGAMITQDNPTYDQLGGFFSFDAGSPIQNHAIEINSKVAVNNAQNLSTLVLDSEASFSGQHGEAANVWGGHTQDPQAGYGQSIGFQLGMMNLDENDPNVGANIASTFAGKWTLAGNSLSYAAAPVLATPVPGAIWMFGTGLMGLLGLNRRKTAA